MSEDSGADRRPAADDNPCNKPMPPGAKYIVVFSDGTGNSSAALFKTNVYRVYSGLDQQSPPPGQHAQIAYYDDGVGTSRFRPLAMLGGAFGIGLKRNVLDLYMFICRNYRPGDRICAFGYSRGAFTVRVLVALITNVGLAKPTSERELRRDAADAYREYRRRYRNWTVDLLRPVRDILIRAKRALSGQGQGHDRLDAGIHFIGVWDTVAAYGLPIAEMTRGVDKWIWPLSMPNHSLNPKVRNARHALALDDERDTFHPLLWNEICERDEYGQPPVGGRLKQVWFSGMHGDVGGGYPDGSLAYVPLRWMVREAKDAGLRFDPAFEQEVDRTQNPCGPIHNSRRGLAAYYRYQPRKISARLEQPDPTTRLMQDPNRNTGFLTGVTVHDSVLQRIAFGTDAYAPIVLPETYGVESARPLGSAAPVLPPLPQNVQPNNWRWQAQEWVWNTVWARRWVYFITVALTVVLGVLPLVGRELVTPTRSDGLGAAVGAVVFQLRFLLPKPLESWADFYVERPGIFVFLVAFILGLRALGAFLGRRIQHRMLKLWLHPAQPPGRTGRLPTNWPYRIRSCAAYQRSLQYLKWKFAPLVFGMLGLGLVLLAGVGIPMIAYKLFIGDWSWPIWDELSSVELWLKGLFVAGPR